MPISHSFAKRLKQRQRQEKQREKEERRKQRRAQRAETHVAPGEDPDLAGIVPGPQPPLEPFDDEPPAAEANDAGASKPGDDKTSQG